MSSIPINPLEEAEKSLKELLEEEFRARAAQDLAAFTVYTKPNYKVAKFHRLLSNTLNRFARGEINRLIVMAPPRHGKSELVSRRLPSYILGNNPDAEIIACSYSADLASRMNRDVQRIMDSQSYIDIFPETRLFSSNVRSVANGTWLRNSDMFEVVGRKGVYRSAGIGGGITGMGADFAIIDDPIKDAAQAESKTYRDGVWEWYLTTLYSRLETKGSILLTLTRWHHDDMAGRLIELSERPGGEKWTILAYPALKEEHPYSDPGDTRQEGESLWPGKYDQKRMLEMKSAVGTRVFTSLWGQRPTLEAGGIIKRAWIKFWKELPARFDEIGHSWDLSNKEGESNDYSVGQVWGRQGGNFYLIDQVRGKMGFPEEVSAIKSLRGKHARYQFILIEQKGNGYAVIQHLQNEIPGIVPFDPKSSKGERLSSVSPLFEAGNVFYPDPSIAPWVHDNIEELIVFPGGKHDDTVDCTSQVLIRFQGRVSGVFTDAYSKLSPTMSSTVRKENAW